MEEKRKRPRQDHDDDNEVRLPGKKMKTVSNKKRKKRK